MKRLLAVLLLTIALWPAPAQAEMPTLGTRQLLDMIAEAKGKVVMVNFFGAYCPPCRKEIPGLMKIRREIPEDQLLIVGIGVDEDPAETEKYVKGTGVNYPTYWSLEAAVAFRVESIPHNIIYTKEGKAIFNEAGLVPEKQLADYIRNLIDAK